MPTTKATIGAVEALVVEESDHEQRSA